MNNNEVQLLKNLTQERKELEKRIKKLNRKKAVLKFLTHEVSGRHYNSPSVPMSMMLGILAFAVGVFSLIFVPISLGLAILGLSLIPVVTSIATYGKVLDSKSKTEESISELKKQRNEILKHLNCVRTKQPYVVPKPELSSEEKYQQNLKVLVDGMIQTQQKRHQRLVEKAKNCNIPVDNIKQGPSAFNSKKDYKQAKEEFKNFLEENDEDPSSFMD